MLQQYPLNDSLFFRISHISSIHIDSLSFTLSVFYGLDNKLRKDKVYVCDI
jgi:hypothetical protein